MKWRIFKWKDIWHAVVEISCTCLLSLHIKINKLSMLLIAHEASIHVFNTWQHDVHQFRKLTPLKRELNISFRSGFRLNIAAASSKWILRGSLWNRFAWDQTHLQIQTGGWLDCFNPKKQKRKPSNELLFTCCFYLFFCIVFNANRFIMRMQTTINLSYCQLPDATFAHFLMHTRVYRVC